MALRILLVIPFYTGDKGQVERLGKWMGQLSGGKRIGEEIHFCATPTCDPIGVGNNFVGLFDKMSATRQIVAANVLPGEAPWPKNCNHQFLHLAKYICENREDIDAFYYFEPDNLPLTPDWWDRVCADYETQGKPFWGVKAENVERDPDGRNPRIDGYHMIGTGMYPRDAWKRIALYKEIEGKQPNRPWDALTRHEINPQCHFTDLIFNCHGCRGYRDNTVIARTSLDAEFKRRPLPQELIDKAVVFHGVKDGSLRAHLARERGYELDPFTFVHAGDIGDIFYALPSVKYYGGGILRLSSNHHARESLTPERVEAMRPLLEAQTYIQEVQPYVEGEYTDFDYRSFRVLHRAHTILVDDQADWIGAPKGLGNQKWLTAGPTKRLFRYVINRTPRYQNDKFPWKKLAKMKLDATFLGSLEEYAALVALWPELVYTETKNFLEVAALISGADYFIGNQSSCFAVAEGLKHPRIQESSTATHDCIFEGDKHAVYCLDGKLDTTLLLSERKDESMEFNLEQLLKDPKFVSTVEDLVNRQIEKLLK